MEEKTAKKVGRPSSFTQAKADYICEMIANGHSLIKICEMDGQPNRVTVLRWLEANESFRTQYARAREAQAEFMAEQIVEIADDTSGDYKTIVDDEGKEIEVADHDHIQRSRLRVDARKWLASKLAPKKYGDKMAHDVDLKGKVSFTMKI